MLNNQLFNLLNAPLMIEQCKNDSQNQIYKKHIEAFQKRLKSNEYIILKNKMITFKNLIDSMPPSFDEAIVHAGQFV